MSLNRGLFWLILIFAGMSAACAASRKYPPLRLATSTRLVEPGRSPYASSRSKPKAIQPIAQVEHKPRNVLVLSGGGANGTYTAGVLAGWSESGHRPQFDVVTGISIGAIIAPFAFLGPDYDEVLVHNANLRGRDIYRRRRLPALLWSDSLADSTPLQRRISELVTDELLERIAVEHERGRRLYIGTTNLDTKRLVVWDMGAIAAGDDPERLRLFRKIIIASAAVPPLLPSVPINVEVNGNRHTELHVDGGTTAALFLHPAMLGFNPKQSGRKKGDQHVYVIMASSLQQPSEPVERTLARVGGESLSTVLHAKMLGELERVQELSTSAGASFSLAAIPSGIQRSADGMAFDRDLMRRLFDQGFRSALDGSCWRNSLPSELTADDYPPPRRGVQFEVNESPPIEAPPSEK